MTLNSIIQIGPEILNNTLNVSPQPSMGYDILQGAVALMVGFLIFLTFGSRLRLIKLIDRTKEGKNKYLYDLDAWLLLGMVVAAAISAIFSLLGNAGLVQTHDARLYATFFFIASLIALSGFAFSLLYKYHLPNQL